MDKKRASRTTQRQYEIYVEELENNSNLRTNKFSNEEMEDTWKRLTCHLNSVGPARPEQAWKRIFTDWKSQIRKKARLLRLESTQTGGGPPSWKKITDIEERLIKCIGSATIIGTGLPEIGIQIDTISNLNNEIDIEPIEPMPVQSVFTINTEITESQKTSNRKRKHSSEKITIKRGVDGVVEAFEKNRNAESNFHNKLLAEIQDLKDVLKKQNEIMQQNNNLKLMKIKIQYSVAKQNYPNLNLEWNDLLS